MTPADLGRILFGSVLRVVDEKIGAIEEFGVPQVLPGEIPVTGRQHTRVGFMVATIHDRHPVGLQPITKRKRWMIQIVGGDLDIVDIEGTLNEVVIANLGPALIEREREIGIPHLPRQSFAQGLAEALRAVDVPFVAAHKKRGEEWDALDVIPMRVADQNVAAQALSAGRYQILT